MARRYRIGENLGMLLLGLFLILWGFVTLLSIPIPSAILAIIAIAAGILILIGR